MSHKFAIYNNRDKNTPVEEREYWAARSSSPGALHGDWGLLSDADFYDDRTAPLPVNGAWVQVDQARDLLLNDTLFCSIGLCESEASAVIYSRDRIFYLCSCCLEAFELGQSIGDYSEFSTDDELPGLAYEENLSIEELGPAIENFNAWMTGQPLGANNAND